MCLKTLVGHVMCLKRLITVLYESSEPFLLLVPSLHIESTDSMIKNDILAQQQRELEKLTALLSYFR